MFLIRIKKVFVSVLMIFNLFDMQAQTGSAKNISEGIVYSRTTFPGHKLNDSIKSLGFVNGDFVKQYDVIQALKKYQQLIGQVNEQEIKDAFFASGKLSQQP